jgi:hypothetical protein
VAVRALAEELVLVRVDPVPVRAVLDLFVDLAKEDLVLRETSLPSVHER